MKYIKKVINHVIGYLGFIIVKKSTIEQFIENQQRENKSDIDLQIENSSINSEIIKTVDIENINMLLKHQISIKWGIIDHIEESKNISFIVCPLCAFKSESLNFTQYVSACIFEGGVLIRHQCPECDVIFGPQKMFSLTNQMLTQDYEWHYRIFSEGDSTESELRAFYALKPTKNGVYLNWGAGSWSNTIAILRDEGWNVYGYEPHSSAAQQNVYILSTEEQLATMQFDGIFSNNVLEHLRHPVLDLINMKKYLTESGKMSHATPCFEYLYEYTRFHLFFFLGRSPLVLAKKASLFLDEFIKDGEFINIIFTKKS